MQSHVRHVVARRHERTRGALGALKSGPHTERESSVVNKRTSTSPRPRGRHPARKRSRTPQQPGSPTRLDPPDWEESEIAGDEIESRADPSRALGETGEDEDLPDLDMERPGAGTRSDAER